MSLPLRGAAFRVLGHGLGALIGLACAALIVHSIGVAQYGRYATIISIVLLVVGVTDSGLWNLAVERSAVLSGPELDRYLRNLLGLQVVVTAGGLIVALALVYAFDADRSVMGGVAAAGLGGLVFVFQNTLAAPLAGTLRLEPLTLVELVRSFSTLAFVALVVAFGGRVVPLAAAQVPIGVVTLLATLALLGGAARLKPVFHPRTWRRTITRALSYSIAAALYSVYFRVAVIGMAVAASALETGYFAAASRVTEAVAAVPVLLASAALAVLSKARASGAEAFASRLRAVTELAWTGGVWLAGTLALAAPVALRILGGSAIAAAVPVLRIYSIAVAACALSAAWQSALLARGEHRTLLAIDSAGLVLLVALLAAPLPGGDAQGAAVAGAVAESVVAAGSGLIVALRMGTSSLLSVGSAVAAGAAAVASLSLLLPLGTVARVIVANALFMTVLAASRAALRNGALLPIAGGALSR